MKKNNTRFVEALQPIMEDLMQKKFENAGNYLMTFPRKGYETEFNKAVEQLEVLDEIIKLLAVSGSSTHFDNEMKLVVFVKELLDANPHINKPVFTDMLTTVVSREAEA